MGKRKRQPVHAVLSRSIASCIASIALLSVCVPADAIGMQAPTGHVTSEPNSAGRTSASYEAAETAHTPAVVATYWLSQDMDSFPRERHSLNLHFNGSRWYATIDAFGGTELYVARYKYGAHDGMAAIGAIDSFPEFARFDWSEDATPRFVIGVPCDLAWCLIGVKDPYMSTINDPKDPTTNVPVTKRVRGWFDRRYDQRLGQWSYVYPKPRIGQLSHGNFTSPRPLAETAGGAAGQKSFAALDDGTANWRLIPYPASATATMTRSAQGTYPGITRWGAELIGDAELPPKPVANSAASPPSMKFSVRCGDAVCTISWP